jgi:uncharacterized membrane protein
MKRKRKARSVVKSRSEQIGDAVAGAVIGGIIAGPVGAVAGAVVGTSMEKGPKARRSATKKPRISSKDQD